MANFKQTATEYKPYVYLKFIFKKTLIPAF